MRLSEVYQSVQGEGPRVGTPTTFVRFGGCNLRCPGWPCDTPFAIDPSTHRQEWEKLRPQEVADRISLWPHNICFTGGEPMLQNTEELKELTYILLKRDQHIEMFTNGTIEYPDWILKEISIVMDWKLDGSGEGINAFGANNVKRVNNFFNLTGLDVVKFTIASKADFQQAVEIWREYMEGDASWVNPEPIVYAGIVWGKDVSNSELVEWMLAHSLPWKLNMQIHNHVWARDQRGT